MCISGAIVDLFPLGGGSPDGLRQSTRPPNPPSSKAEAIELQAD